MLNFEKHGANKPLYFTLLTVLFFLLFISISEMLGWPFLKKPLETLMEKRFDRGVKLDSPFKIRFIGGIKIETGRLWISAPPEIEVPNLLDAKNLKLTLRYKDVWDVKLGDPYVVKSIQADQIEAHFVRVSNGKSTWKFNQDENKPRRPFPLIQSLVILNGIAKVNDSLTKTNLAITFSTDEGSANNQSQSILAVTGDFREHKLTSKLTTSGFLQIAAQTKSSAPISSKGWLQYGNVNMQFDGLIYDLFGEQKVEGKLVANGPSLGDLGDLLKITLPRTSSFKLSGNIEKNQDKWLINITSGQVGQSDLYGNFIFDRRPEKHLLLGTIKGKRFVLADLAPAFGNDSNEVNKPKARVFPDKRLNFATYNRMNAKITFDIDYVDLGKAFREPLRPFKASLELNKNKLSFAKIYAKTAQGTIAGNFYIDAENPKEINPQKENDIQFEPDNTFKPKWAIDLSFNNINLEKWLQVSDARKKEVQENNQQNVKNRDNKKIPLAYVTGLLNVNAKFNGEGRSTAELLGSLNGNLSMDIRNGEVSHLLIEAAGLDIAQALGVLIKGDRNLKMQCAVASFNAKKGLLYTNVALIDTEVTTVLIDGDVKLGEEKLNLRMTAEPKNFSPFTVRSPIELTGTFLHPNLTPKAQPIAARVVGSALLAFINPFAAIIPFLDPGKGDASKTPTCNDTLNTIKTNIKKQKESNLN